MGSSWAGGISNSNSSSSRVDPQQTVLLDWPVIARELHLSPRETAVVQGLWHGRKHAAIAADLGISIHTLDTHWRRIKYKLDITSPVGAVHRVYGVVMDSR